MRPRALLLDLGDTVFGLGPYPLERVSRALERILGGTLADGADVGAQAKLLLQGWRARAVAAYEEGDLGEHWPSTIVAGVAAEIGLRLPVSAGPAIDDAFGAADVSRFLVPADAPARLEWARAAGLRVVGVSNTTTEPQLLKRFLEAGRLLECFDGFVFSIVAGVRKPHERIYAQALELAGVGPREAVFVGDRVREDVTGPQAVGIQAVLTHEFRQEDPGAAGPRHVITSLAHLRAVLGFD